MDRHPLIICYVYEKADVKPLFPEPCMVVTEGQALGTFRASVILATKHININSEWFKAVAMPRLGPGGKVLRINA